MAREYQAYKCPNKAAAMTCNKECTIDDMMGADAKFIVKFLVNVEQQKVIRTDEITLPQKDGMPFRTLESQVLENCTVIDKKNWMCEPSCFQYSPEKNICNIKRMLKGIYSAYSKFSHSNNKDWGECYK